MKRLIIIILLLTTFLTNSIAQQPCNNPTAISVSNITTTGSDISWIPGGAEAAWDIEYGPSGFSLGSGTIAAVTTNSYNIVGLSSATNYDIYVRADCGGGSLSNWEGPYNFLTSFSSPNNINCSTGNSTSFFIDDLDSTGYWSGDFGTTNGSWRVFSGPTSTPNTGPNGAHNGNSYFYFESSVGGLDTASIISPVVDLSNAVGNQAELSFYYHFYGSSGATLDVSISSDLINYSSLGTFSMYQTSDTDPFVYVGLDLSAYVGQIIYLKFTYVRGSQGTPFQGDIAIDLVEVKACSQTSSCYFYGDTTNISLCADSVEWENNYYYSSGLHQDTVYNFGTCDSVIYLDLTLTSFPVIDLVTDTLICDSSVITLDAGIGQSSYSWSTGETTQSITYMGTHQGNFGVTDEVITLSVVGNNGCSNSRDILVSTINCDTSSSCYYTIDMQDSYGDGWNGAYLSVMINGVQYPQNFTVNSGYSNEDGFPTYNGDVVDFYFNSGPWDSEISFVIYDPLGLPLGMYGPNPPVGLFLTDTSNSSCVDVVFSCPSPSNLSAHYVDSNTTNLSWNLVGNESSWDLEYGLSGQALGQGNLINQVNNNQYLLTGLSENTSYRYYVRSRCGSTTSQWIGPFTFVTSKLFGTWKLADIAGALQVGPNQGDASWWSSSLADATTRACIFDDSINFDGLGGMTHYMDGSTWLETWQGVSSEQCGTPVTPHNGGNFTYTYFNNQLTVNGLGAHLGLPKAFNGGELSNPNNAVNSITYEIDFSSNYDTMIVDVQSAGGGSGWWRFIYNRTNILPPVPICDSLVFTENHTVCDSLTWIDGNTYTSSNNTASYTFTNSFGCDSIVMLDLTVNNPVSNNIFIIVCDTFNWNGVNYFNSGIYTDTLQSSNGCDSTVTMDLVINYSIFTNDSAEACDSFEWNGNIYTSSGIYIDTLQTITGCDSVITLDLIINNTINVTDSQTVCDSYNWNGNIYTLSGIYTDTLLASNGCDSIVILDLTVTNSVSNNIFITACDTFNWNGNIYTNSGIYLDALITTNGCDSIVTLDLTINNTIYSVDSQTACDSYNWNGNIYDSTGYYVDTLQSLNSCDSIVTLDLTVNYTSNLIHSVISCHDYIWNGNLYSNSGFYFDTLQSITGCDSLVTLSLIIKEATVDTIFANSCDFYSWRGNIYNQSGIYQDTLQSIFGCDSILLLDLTLANSSFTNDSVTSCQDYLWNGNTYNLSGIYSNTFSSFEGCDSVVTLYLTIINSVQGDTLSISECDEFIWQGNQYNQTGLFSDTLLTNSGCDSIIYLNLTVNGNYEIDEYVNACTSYNWNGISYSLSGEYIDTLQSSFGCDSIVNLNLTILNNQIFSDTILSCESYIWNGFYLDSTGLYTDTLQTIGGCDSILILDLTVYENAFANDSVSTCEFYDWNGVRYTSSGVYVDTFQTSNGCDSIVSLSLNLFPVYQDTIFASACDSFVWYGNTYTSAGIYTNSFSTINGCDSVEVLNFSLNNDNNTSPIDFELVLDNFCLETHWNIVSSDGIVVHQEGPYDCNINGSGLQSNQTINRSLSLEQQDCYTFTLYDDFGDGLGASQWGGTDGSWLLNDLNGNSLFQGQGNFGDSVSVSFYINEDFSTSIIESENNFSEIIAYPNPFIGETEIKLINFEGLYDVSIRDIQGKIVHKLYNLSNNHFTLRSSIILRGVYWVVLDNHPTIKPLKLIVQ